MKPHMACKKKKEGTICGEKNTQIRNEKKGRKEKEKGGETTIFLSWDIKVIILILSIKFLCNWE